MMQIKSFQKSNRIAKVFSRTFGGYRVWMYDMFTEYQEEVYYNDVLLAEQLAKEWCNYE